MLNLLFGVTTRIFSNSYLNVVQKFMTNKGEYPSVINFYTYFGLTILGLLICPKPIYNEEILLNLFIMGALGTTGNYFIIKALSQGELSMLAPINSYKPIVALVFGVFLLNEVPSYIDLLGILLIISGTFLLNQNKLLYNIATLYRFWALFFSGAEAVFIKKIILLSDVPSSFLYWAIASFIFTIIFICISKHSIKLEKSNYKYQILLVLLVAIMQYSTNYVFSKINVSHALALFQLSTIVSVFLGVNIFKENNLLEKVVASAIMLVGAVVIILA